MVWFKEVLITSTRQMYSTVSNGDGHLIDVSRGHVGSLNSNFMIGIL